VAYVYSQDRRGERPAGHLAGFRGVLQVDGYAGFERLAGDRADALVRLAFCWAHMRRPFYQFFISTQSPLAAEVLARIRALYAIEAEICGHPAEHRRQVRHDEVDPSWTPCTAGCTTIWAACPPLPTWRKPSAMRSRANLLVRPGTRTGWSCSSTMAASRWTPTSSSAPSDQTS